MNNSKKVKLVKLEEKERYQRLLREDLETYRIKSGHVILKPDDSIGSHSTGEREEMIVVLKGNGELSIDKGAVLKIDCSTILYIPPYTYHDVKNTGSKALEYIFITAKTK